jgi:hypothetical protein
MSKFTPQTSRGEVKIKLITLLKLLNMRFREEAKVPPGGFRGG